MSVTFPATGMERMWCGGGNGWPPMRPKPYTGNGLFGRVDERPSTSSRSVPIQRTRACQSHQRYAAYRRSPQPPALGGVVGVSRHSGEPQSPGGDIARKVAKALSQCRLPQRIPNSLKLANAFSSTTIALTTKGTSKHSQALRVKGRGQYVPDAHL